ncbi:MAG TPA: hypothetical protein VGS22_22335 [Thermoanaerobaculia bacterium]|jgi:hypothetical protein|nr:hypothetical protein [Thermoanaerobaculia bacterium]
MNEKPGNPSRWQALLNRMFEELRSGEPRAETYWAQQLAFGPVFFYAVVLAVREGSIAPGDLDLLRHVIPLALALLGALPDGGGGDPTRLLLLARRQAVALASGRRHRLTRLAARLGLEASKVLYDPVPNRLQRPYEVMGWCPPPVRLEADDPSSPSASA